MLELEKVRMPITIDTQVSVTSKSAFFTASSGTFDTMSFPCVFASFPESRMIFFIRSGIS